MITLSMPRLGIESVTAYFDEDAPSEDATYAVIKTIEGTRIASSYDLRFLARELVEIADAIDEENE